MSRSDMPDDDLLAEALAAYDDALRISGPLPSEPRHPSEETELTHGQPPHEPATTELNARLGRLQDVLRRLETDRRRHGHDAHVTTDCQKSTPAGTAPLDVPYQLGRFEVSKELGRGGWGIVFLAWDPILRRNVALKVPRPEALLAADHRKRFVREAQTMGSLDHPGIVPLYESGEIGPIWYIASAYCPGQTLANWLRQHLGPVAVREAVDFAVRLAEIVEYTHHRGIVHRDLKPSNILLPTTDRNDTSPASDFASPRITDFGLARFLERDDDQTQSGLLLGTPAYMAPEQASGRLSEIGPATDVYAMGVILYELLTGRVPFRGEGDLETLTLIGRAEPVPPGRLRGGLPRDLEAICLKCLEKAPQRRYPRAGDLAEDLRRFLAGKTTLARPLSIQRRTLKWCRRRPALAALAGVAVLAILVISSLGVWHVTEIQRHNEDLKVALDEAQQQRTLAQQRERTAQRESYAALMGRASRFHDRDETGLLSEVLNMLRPPPHNPSAEDLREFAWHYLWNQVYSERFLRGHVDAVNSVSMARNGTVCASGSHDGTIVLWDVATGQPRARLDGHRTRVLSVAFSVGGEQLVSAGGNDRLNQRAEVKLWDVASGQLCADLAGPMTYAEAAAFTVDGQSVVIAGSMDNDQVGVVFLHDLKTGQSRLLFECRRRVTSLAVSPNGRFYAVGCGRPLEDIPAAERDECGTIVVWDLVTGRKHALPSPDGHLPKSLVFSPVDDVLFSGGFDGTIRRWDMMDGTGSLVAESPNAKKRAWVDSLVLTSDGSTLLATIHDLDTRNSSLYQWDLDARVQRTPPIQVDYAARSLVLSTDNRTLAVAGDDHLVRLWNLGARPKFVELRGHTSEVWSVAFSPDGKTLVSASDDHTVRLWDLTTGRQRATLTGHESLVSDVTFSANGHLLASASYDLTAKLWDARTGRLQATFRGHTQPIRAATFSPDKEILATAAKDGRVILWDLSTHGVRRQLVGHQDVVRCLVFAERGRTLITASNDRTIRFWDTSSGVLIRELQEASEIWSLALSADGTLLASGSKDRLIKIWELPSGELRSVLGGHTGGIRSLTFSPDGRTLFSGSEDRSVSLWQPSTGHELLAFKDLPSAVNSVAISPDGQILAAALHDGTIRLWLAPKGHSDSMSDG